MGEFGEFVDIGVHSAHEAFQLRQDLVDVGGNFRERARKDIEIIVAVHLEFAEFQQIAGHDRWNGLEARPKRIHLRGLATGHKR